MRFRIPLALAAPAAACLLTIGSSSAPARAMRSVCGYPGYSYAGFQAPAAAYGVAGRVIALASPAVRSGHVAAWIGVGGSGMGPGSTDEWIQVGIAGHLDGSQELYYEYAQPGTAEAVFVSLGAVAVGEAHDVALAEPAAQPNVWRVWLDRRRVGPPIVLPGSHGAWLPIATAETWDGGIRGCNRYSYSFSKLAVATKPGGGWRPFPLTRPLRDPGFAVSTRASGFSARTLP